MSKSLANNSPPSLRSCSIGPPSCVAIRRTPPRRLFASFLRGFLPFPSIISVRTQPKPLHLRGDCHGSGRDEVSNVLSDRHLTTEADSQLFARKPLPENLLRRSRGMPHS